jgi:hypothetical protein
VLGLNGWPHVRQVFIVMEFAGAPHTPQNLDPGFKGLLHLVQFIAAMTEGVPQNAQNFAPGTRVLLHF